MKIFIKTFGCRTNIYDSELLKSYITKANILVDDENSADIIVVNSCTVTNGADSDVRNYINRLNALNKKVILTGCGASSQGAKLLNHNKISGVFGASYKHKINDFLKNEKFFELGELDYKENEIIKGFERHSKGFIKIQEGCDFSCSYCIIPSVRGKARSLDERLILNQAQILIQNGFSELVLTGTNIGSYGKDNNSSLAKLLKKISTINGLKRVRLGSLEPSQIDKEFKEILNEGWLERHLHIALQHTSQTMLSLMRRANKAWRDQELFYELSELGFALGTDYIVAHPGESDEVFDEAVSNFKQLPITHLHGFIFSPREGTKSALMLEKHPQINGKIAKERLKILKNISDLNNFKFRSKKPRLQVLCEKLDNDGYYSGFDQFYNKIKIKSNQNLSKKWVEISEYEVEFSNNVAKL